MTREEVLAEIAAAITDERYADLTGADLRGADLTGADLRGANMRGANLAGADLIDADLRVASLRGANLAGAYLAGAELGGADLTRANLRGASLAHANLADADLTGANLADAILRDANLWNADLTGADLGGAELWGAYLGDVDLIGANMRGANMRGANMRGANLGGADLTRANLQGASLARANLADADLTGANLADATGLDDLSGEPRAWPAGFTLPVIEATPARAYGKHTAAVLKLRRPETPRAARDFKRMYPTEFESLKSVTQGRDFTPETVERLRYAYESHVAWLPVEWLLTTGKYESEMQRLCASPNDVLKFNVRIDAEQYTEAQRDILSKLRETSKRSGHPVEKKPFFTVGWVRCCVDDAAKTWLIEEVQSDVQGVRKGLKDPAARRQLEDGGLPPERVDEAVALLHPYMARFYEDALGVVFDLAQQKGYNVEMLEYEDKRSMGSPRQIYTDLPKSMGMRLGPGSAVLSGVQRAWKITPNRRRKTSRRAAPRAAQRKTSRGRS